jgi:hypothetical protein
MTTEKEKEKGKQTTREFTLDGAQFPIIKKALKSYRKDLEELSLEATNDKNEEYRQGLHYDIALTSGLIKIFSRLDRRETFLVRNKRQSIILHGKEEVHPIAPLHKKAANK